MEHSVSSLERKPTIKGMIDGLTSGVLSGWVFDSSYPVQSQRFFIELDGNIIRQEIAHCYRQDLVDHGFKYGKHGFFVRLGLTYEQLADKKLRLLDEAQQPIQDAEWFMPTVANSVSFQLLSQQAHHLNFLVTSSTALEQVQLTLRYGDAGIALSEISLPSGESSLQVAIPLAVLDGFDDVFSLELAGFPAPVWVAKEYSFSTSTMLEQAIPSSDFMAHSRHKTLDLQVEHASGCYLTSALSAYRYLLTGSDEIRLEYVRQQQVDVSVFLAFSKELNLAGLRHTLASILFAYNRCSFELLLVGAESQRTQLIELMAEHDIEYRFISIAEIDSFASFYRRLGNEAQGRYSVVITQPLEVTSFWLDELIKPFEQGMQPQPDVTTAKTISTQGDTHIPAAFLDINGQLWRTEQSVSAAHPSVNYIKQVSRSDASVWCVLSSLFVEDDSSGTETFDHSALSIKSLSDVRKTGLNLVYTPFSEVISLASIRCGRTCLGDSLAKKKRVLVIDHALPSVNEDAGSYAAVQEIKLIQSLGYEVLFVDAKVSTCNKKTMYLQELGVEVIYRPFFSSIESVIHHYIDELCALYVTRYNVADRVLPIIKRVNSHLPILFNNADLHFLRELRAAINANNPQLIHQATLTRDRELSVMRRVDAILSYNDTEHAVIASHLLENRKIHTCPWVLEEKKEGLPFENREGIAFLGGYLHAPNVEAVCFFVEQVIPLLAIKAPDITFYIYGSNMPDSFNNFVASNIKRVGFVENLDELYHQHRLFVAPLLSGAGIKGKVLESLAYGLPTVLSSVAAEGIGLTHNISTLIAETAEQWCDEIIRLYHDKALWLRISENQKIITQTKFSFLAGQQQMRAVFASVGLESV